MLLSNIWSDTNFRRNAFAKKYYLGGKGGGGTVTVHQVHIQASDVSQKGKVIRCTDGKIFKKIKTEMNLVL